MVLSNFDELALRLLSYFNFFMWPFPLKWDYSKSKLVSKRSFWNIPYYIAITYICLFGWMCVFTTIYVEVKERKYLAKINTGCMVIIGTTLLALVVITHKGLKNLKA